MKLAIIIYSNDSETVWNAFRIANYSLFQGSIVKIFLMGKGVECKTLDKESFNINELIYSFKSNGGEIFACGTCMELRKMNCPEEFKISTLKELDEIIKESDKVLTF